MRICPVNVVMGAVVCGVVAAFAALPAHAGQATSLAVTVAPDALRYSQATEMQITLTYVDGGAGVAGDDCVGAGSTNPCFVSVYLAPADDAFDEIKIGEAALNASGVGTLRLSAVDGRHDAASTFPAADDGRAYDVRAVFDGKGTPPFGTGGFDCAAADPAEICPAQGTSTLVLTPETTDLVLGVGLDAAVGDTVTITADLTDPNGDAAASGNDIDGDGPKALAGQDIGFYFDFDNNGRADAIEAIGSAVTDDDGHAAIEFFLDPELVRAGTFDEGVQAEFGGGDRYGLARASTEITIHPADIDVDKTLLEVDPGEIPADGASTLTVRARLVDIYGNLLDAQAEPHQVVFSTDLGTLVDSASLDPLTGSYTQTLRAGRQGGKATIRVVVDDTPGPKVTAEFTGGSGCQCALSSSALSWAAAPDALLLSVLVLALKRVARTRTQPRKRPS